MASSSRKPRKKTVKRSPPAETPPGATRKALDRPLERGGGAPGSAAGPRHAADDTGTEDETFGRTDLPRTHATPPPEEEYPLEKGPPYAGTSGGAIGGTPAQMRSSEGPPHQDSQLENQEAPSTLRFAAPPDPDRQAAKRRLTGFPAIEYAEKQGLLLNKHPDSINGPRIGLNVAEAEAIAEEDPDLIWLDVDKEDYYSGPPSNYEPQD